MSNEPLGIGIIGSGFNARFHIRGWVGVRDGDVRGVWSPNRANAESAVALAHELGVGADARAYASIGEMVADPAIDAIWLTGPNHARIENVEEIVRAIEKGATLKDIACEKPLARNVREARRVVELVESVGLVTGYLENQAFAPHIEVGRNRLWARGATVAGRPYLARAAEEHSGPHAPWFWNGQLQGGGVLNDMMCHSALVVRWLLTRPGRSLATVRPVRITGHIASLKWTRPAYSGRVHLSEAMCAETRDGRTVESGSPGAVSR